MAAFTELTCRGRRPSTHMKRRANLTTDKIIVIRQVSDCLRVIRGPLRVSETLTGGLGGQNYVHKNVKMLFAFVTLIPSQAYRDIFQRLLDV